MVAAIATLIRGNHATSTRADAAAPSAVDLGAGLGLYVKSLRSANISAEGYEGAANVEEVSEGVVHHKDLTEPFTPCRAFDWVLHLEVAEHIPREHEPSLLHNLNCSARHGLVISWGAPEQGGVGHVNERSKEYVQQALRPYGLHLDHAASSTLARVAHYTWFRRNVQVFVRRGHGMAHGMAHGGGSHARHAEHDATL